MVSSDTFTASVPAKVIETSEFSTWLDEHGGTDLLRIEAAVARILDEGVVTNAKSLKDGLYERKWASGLRMYFAVAIGTDGNITLLLLASGKGIGQDRTIKMCREIMTEFDIYLGNIAKKD